MLSNVTSKHILSELGKCFPGWLVRMEKWPDRFQTCVSIYRSVEDRDICGNPDDVAVLFREMVCDFVKGARAASIQKVVSPVRPIWRKSGKHRRKP